MNSINNKFEYVLVAIGFCDCQSFRLHFLCWCNFRGDPKCICQGSYDGARCLPRYNQPNNPFLIMSEMTCNSFFSMFRSSSSRFCKFLRDCNLLTVLPSSVCARLCFRCQLPFSNKSVPPRVEQGNELGINGLHRKFIGN